MRRFNRTLILMALFLTCAVTILAQDSQQLIPSKRKFKHNTKIESKYDRSKDQTMVYIDPYHDSSGPVRYFDLLENVILTAGFRYPGKTLTSIPEVIELGVITNSRLGWFFGGSRDLVVIADRKEVFTGPLNMVSKNRPNGATYVEILSLALPTDVFLKIANSNAVEMRAGPQVQFKLATEHLEAFRDLASRMKP
jgi:hypothetical protein